MASNIDLKTVEGFGAEWQRFDQQALSAEDLAQGFREYFQLFPWDELPPNAVGFDLGCGSGRWAGQVAPRVGHLHCIDPSQEALSVARRSLDRRSNCTFHHAGVSEIPLADGSMDFGYSLGVLHHVPDTAAGIADCVRKLKPGAPFLLYLYYAFDNRPSWFRAVWKGTDLARRVISRLPNPLRHGVSDIIAATVYLPMARAALAVEAAGLSVETFPLSHYRHRSFYSMRTDALDRFGTRLEQRFTADEVVDMMTRAGLRDIRIGDAMPFWCAVGRKR